MKAEDQTEMWGGIECTINRVGEAYHDQFEFGSHYERTDDIDLIASLGIKKLRFPVIWEKHQPSKDRPIDWEFTDRKLSQLKKVNVAPIIGLVHHGSGPKFVNFFDGSFERGLEKYAQMVAERYPWLEYYTPVNEPLTTARFCGLYGHWYPHQKDDLSFYKILISECKATVMAMKAIRQVNPNAKLVQTEDLGKTYSTPLLRYQADFENERRWLSYELLCGRLTPDKVMYRHMIQAGIEEAELDQFLADSCTPDIAGFNYYVTSERYLDEDVSLYPKCYEGGNGKHRYADVEIVKVFTDTVSGPEHLLKEAWERLRLPMAISECHLNSTREDQLRWFYDMWTTVQQLNLQGIDIRAVTVWAIFGLHGWDTLVTKPNGNYESGVYNISSGQPRPTALVQLIRSLSTNGDHKHPLLNDKGWWKRHDRFEYRRDNVVHLKASARSAFRQPLLILGHSRSLGEPFKKICDERAIYHVCINLTDAEKISEEAIQDIIARTDPWAVVNINGYEDPDNCDQLSCEHYRQNTFSASMISKTCKYYGIKFLTFSSAEVFDGQRSQPYNESDPPCPTTLYGESKAEEESAVIKYNEEALVIRSGQFFSPWATDSRIDHIVSALREGLPVIFRGDERVSPTYIPDLVHASLNLLIDNETGIWHVTNAGEYTWQTLTHEIAQLAGVPAPVIKNIPLEKLKRNNKGQGNFALQCSRSLIMPTVSSALKHYLEVTRNYHSSQAQAI